MMNGATMPPGEPTREAGTSRDDDRGEPAPAAGHARRSALSDQARPRRDAARARPPPESRARSRPRRRPLATSPTTASRDGVAARRLLERGGVELGDPARRRARAGRARARRAPIERRTPSSRGEQLEGRRERVDLVARRRESSAPPSSGSSENQPTSLTTSGLPSESARIALPDVSPIVGARRLTQTSQAAISAQRRSSST